MRRAKWMSRGKIVTRFAWMAHRFASSNREVRYASAASCSANSAVPWNRKSFLKSWAISLTNRSNGSRRKSRFVVFWYRRISCKATVPGRNRCGFLMPPVHGADLRAAFVASCLRGALPPVDFREVCLVLVILILGFWFVSFKFMRFRFLKFSFVSCFLLCYCKEWFLV